MGKALQLASCLADQTADGLKASDEVAGSSDRLHNQDPSASLGFHFSEYSNEIRGRPAERAIIVDGECNLVTPAIEQELVRAHLVCTCFSFPHEGKRSFTA